MNTIDGKLLCCRVTAAVAFVTCFGLDRAIAQKQEAFVEQASARLQKLIKSANADGYVYEGDRVSMGGAYLKREEKDWFAMATIKLDEGRSYRIIAVGDNDALDVDLRIVGEAKVLAADTSQDPEAVVHYRPVRTGQYIIQLRLYQSRQHVSCFCMYMVLVKTEKGK